MNVFKTFKNFHENEDGAVNVDWVVLTAACVGLAIAVVSALQAGFDTATGNIQADLSGNAPVSTTNPGN